jgi:14-3-3 protein epsilon
MGRDDNIFMAKICEQTERFEDMVEYMKAVATEGNEGLSIEERNLLSVAYKNAIGPHRTAWRAISSIQTKEEAKASKHIPLLKAYKEKIEKELDKFCYDILKLLDNKLIKGAESDNESKVFYLKMKGDYHRYIAEYASGEAHDEAQKKALDAYSMATEVADANLKTTHPIRLGLALNSSVFHYEVMNDPTKACSLAKTAFDNAIADIEQLDDDVYKDATTIMQLIRDNLTLWTSELEEDQQGD